MIFLAVLLVGIMHTSVIISEQPTYYAQYAQDKFVHEQFFRDKKNGMFIDIGATDGITGSNTYFFEKELGWEGLCIEPRADQYQLLVSNRRCACFNGLIGNKTSELRNFIVITGYAAPLSGFEDTYDVRHIQRINYEVEHYGGTIHRVPVSCVPLRDVLEHYGIDYIDYLSIDTEGSELEILQSINFNKVFIDVIVVENNYSDPSINEFLTSKGYAFVTRIECDEVYRKKR